MIEIFDAVERKVVATGTAIIDLGGNNRGVTNCAVQPGQQLQVGISYNLRDTANGSSVSAKCTARPGAAMQTASFELN
jgi:hypothetical protein